MEIYLVKKDFKLIFDSENTPHMKSDFQNDSSSFQLQQILLLCIGDFIERG